MQRIVEVENAIIENIKKAKLPYLRFLGSYSQELSGDFAKVVRALPAIWVVFRGASAAKPLNTARDRWRAEYTFSTVVAARSLRSEAAGRHGTECMVGSYDMLKDVHTLTCLNDFGLDGVDYLQPGAVKQLFNGEVQGHAISVYSQEWTALVDYHFREPGQRLPNETPTTGYLPDNADTLHDFTAIGLKYWLKPPREVDIDPPDAVDNVTLNIKV